MMTVGTQEIKPKPTPGPWVASQCRPRIGTRQTFTLWHDDGSEDGYVIGVLGETTQANAHLVAAAPELLEAAISAFQASQQNADGSWSISHATRNELWAAIQKAKG